MSRLGLILCDISQKLNNDLTIESLREILKDCIENNLYTNKIFTEIILNIVRDGKISQETKNNLRCIGINYDESDSKYTDVHNLHLILM